MKEDGIGSGQIIRRQASGTLEYQRDDLTIVSLKAYPGMTVTTEIFSMWAEGFRKAGLPEG